MDAQLPTFDQVFLAVKERLPLLSVGAAGIVSVVKLTPHIRPGRRAAWLALRSCFAANPVPMSLRSEETKIIKENLASRKFAQSYTVVTGEKGSARPVAQIRHKQDTRRHQCAS